MTGYSNSIASSQTPITTLSVDVFVPGVGDIPYGNGKTLTQDTGMITFDDSANSFAVGGMVNQTLFPGTVAAMTMGAASLGYTQHTITDPTVAGQSCYVCNANDATNTTHYCQISMNNSTGPNPTNTYFANAHAAALYTVDAELDIGAGVVGSLPASIINFYVNGYTLPAGYFNATQQLAIAANQVAIATGRAVNTTATASAATLAAGIASMYIATPSATAITITLAAPTADGERRRIVFGGPVTTITWTPTTPATAVLGLPTTVIAGQAVEIVYNSVAGTPTNSAATTWYGF
jgi:hypothetical protein